MICPNCKKEVNKWMRQTPGRCQFCRTAFLSKEESERPVEDSGPLINNIVPSILDVLSSGSGSEEPPSDPPTSDSPSSSDSDSSSVDTSFDSGSGGDF